MRVLVIGENDAAANELERALAHDGYEVCRSDPTASEFESAKAASPDVIVLSSWMPDPELLESFGEREAGVDQPAAFASFRSFGDLVVYIHGGYWQWGDRTMYSFLARELNASGINVAIPSYSLCPAVSVMGIVGELRMCLAAIWKEYRVRPLVIGHSAGGHLTAAVLGADWSGFADVPSDLVSVGLAISGLFDLTPLVRTSINQAIGLSIESARAASPRFWAPPKQGALVAAVGEHDSSEFHRQKPRDCRALGSRRC